MTSEVPQSTPETLQHNLETLIIKREQYYPASQESDIARPDIVAEATAIAIEARTYLDSCSPNIVQRVLSKDIKVAQSILDTSITIIKEELAFEQLNFPGIARIKGYSQYVVYINESTNSFVHIFISDYSDTADGFHFNNVTNRTGGLSFEQTLNMDHLQLIEEITKGLFNRSTRAEEIDTSWGRRLEATPEIQAAVQRNLCVIESSSSRDSKLQLNNPALSRRYERWAKREDPFIERIIKSFVKSAKLASETVIDIAAGAGKEAVLAIKEGVSKVIALDTSTTSIRQIRRNARRQKMEKQIAATPLDITRDQFPLSTEDDSKGYSAAWILNTLELLPLEHRVHALRQVFEILKPGGQILILAEATPTTVAYKTPVEHALDEFRVFPKDTTFTIDLSMLSKLSYRKSLEQSLGISEAQLAQCATYFDLAYLIRIRATEKRRDPEYNIAGIVFEGLTAEETKALLISLGFAIDYFRTGITSYSDRWSPVDNRKRENLFLIIASIPE